MEALCPVSTPTEAGGTQCLRRILKIVNGNQEDCHTKKATPFFDVSVRLGYTYMAYSLLGNPTPWLIWDY